MNKASAMLPAEKQHRFPTLPLQDRPGCEPGPARRYLAIHFPFLAADRIRRRRFGHEWRLTDRHNPAPLALHAHSGNTDRIVHLCETARDLGLERGSTLADARAAWPQVEFLEDDPAHNGRLLSAIAAWCDRYTPLVAIDTAFPDSHCALMLDITGCARLFGGEAALQDELIRRLHAQGLATATAIAPTPGCAWALAWHHRFNPKLPAPIVPATGTGTGIAEEELAARLSCLPVRALRLDAETADSLARLGLNTIGQLLARPRAPLSKRFGREVLLRLDQALGRVGESLSPLMPVAPMMAERHFHEPLVRTEDVETAMLSLADHLCRRLEQQGKGARHLQLALYRVDGLCLRLEAGTSRAERDPHTMLRLMRERIAGIEDGVDAGHGFETLRLSALSTECFDSVTEEMAIIAGAAEQSCGPDGSARQIASGKLVDRLAARLGPRCVTLALPRDTHLPEESECLIGAGRMDALVKSRHRERDEPAGPYLPGLRPLRLLDRPEPVEAMAAIPDGSPLRFRWRRVLHEIVRSEGPERIADQWWDRPAPRPTRDYYRVEDRLGRRYWLFREGLYGCESDTPAWFMHGFFA